MAFLEMNFYSNQLKQQVAVNVILPERNTSNCASDNPETTFKTLWLLHGLSDNHTTWMRNTAIERYAAEYGIAVVMPCVDRTWYTDTAYGKNCFTFITQELPEMCRRYFKGFSGKREDNLIAGLSMGGYGALKAALTFPENYGFCVSLSGALDITRRKRPCNIEEWRSIFGFELKSPAELEGTKHDLFALSQADKDFPYIYMWCGTEDSLISVNHDFSEHLCNLGVPHAFEYSTGDHSWKWWDLHIQNALKCWSERI